MSATSSRFSPDGSLIASTAETNNGPLQSIVSSTATGERIPWAHQPADLLTTQVGFSDSQTVFVSAIDSSLNSQIWRTTVDTSTRFTLGSAFTIAHTYPGTERYLGYTTANIGVLASNGPRDLALVDLQTNPMPIFPLTRLGSGTLTFSQDVSSAYTYEGFQSGSQLGTLTQISLPSRAKTKIADDVFTGGTSYARGSSKILVFPQSAHAPLQRPGDRRMERHRHPARRVRPQLRQRRQSADPLLDARRPPRPLSAAAPVTARLAVHPPRRSQRMKRSRPAAPRTLAIDIGGTGLKALILDERGRAITDRQRVETPQPATPRAVLAALGKIIAPLGEFDRVSVGFPGVVIEAS